jgi:catechol 2,3-dioxygenase-like lactoylglutathione lyase family enzyme
MRSVRATALNHVSIPAADVDASMRWWQEVFGLEQIPAPNFGFPVRWLRLGDLQLHLYTSEHRAASAQHFGMEVDDFEEAYRRLKGAGAFDEGTRYAHLYELPGGEVQMYFRDPNGNLVEVDHPEVATLDRSLFGKDLKRLADEVPQGAENLRARLFLRESTRV